MSMIHGMEANGLAKAIKTREGKLIVDGHEGWEAAVVDLATDTTTVYDGPCLLRGAYVNTALSAHACPIQDDATPKFTLAASTAAGTYHKFGDINIATKLIVNPNDSGTGNITVIYKPLA